MTDKLSEPQAEILRPMSAGLKLMFDNSETTKRNERWTIEDEPVDGRAARGLLLREYVEQELVVGAVAFFHLTPAGQLALDGYNAIKQLAAGFMQPYVDHAAQQDTKASDTMTESEWTPTVGAKTRIVGSYEYGEIVAIDGDTATVNICKWLETATYPLTALAPYTEGEAPAPSVVGGWLATEIAHLRGVLDIAKTQQASAVATMEQADAQIKRQRAELLKLQAERDALKHFYDLARNLDLTSDMYRIASEQGGDVYIEVNTLLFELSEARIDYDDPSVYNPDAPRKKTEVERDAMIARMDELKLALGTARTERDALAEGWRGYMEAANEERREQYAQITALLGGLDNISPTEALTRLLSFRRTYTQHAIPDPKMEV